MVSEVFISYELHKNFGPRSSVGRFNLHRQTSDLAPVTCWRHRALRISLSLCTEPVRYSIQSRAILNVIHYSIGERMQSSPESSSPSFEPESLRLTNVNSARTMTSSDCFSKRSLNSEVQRRVAIEWSPMEALH